MRPILEILRLDAEAHRSVRRIAASLGLPCSTVADYLRRFRHSGLPWPLPADVDEVVLEARLFPLGPAPQAVRDAIRYAGRSLNIERVLTSKELRTHAGELFLDRYGQLISLSRSGQLAMKKLLDDYLRRVEWDLSDVPFRLYPFVRGESDDAPRNIVIDPAIAFGRPVLLRHGVTTRAITDRIDAGETPDEVAHDYELEPRDVEEAVLYERAA